MASLSIIIPTYNDAARIESAVRRCVNQSRKAKEIIVIDDGSDDDSADILLGLAHQYPPLRIVTCQKNIGTGLSIKLGFENSSGDYVYFGAMDDGIGPQFIEKTLECTEKYPDAGLCCSDAEIQYANRAPLNIHHKFSADHLSPEDAATQLNGQHICGVGAIYRRDAVLGSNIFDPQLRWHCDWFASVVIALRHGICFVPEVHSYATHRPESYSNAGRNNWALQSNVIARAFELMNSEAFSDILPAFIWSRAINHFGQGAVRLMLERPELNTEVNRLLARDAINGEI